MEHPSLTPQGFVFITDVKFQFEMIGAVSQLSLLTHADHNSAHSTSPREACVALGKMLLEIFSGGRSMQFEHLPSSKSNNGTSLICNNVKKAMEGTTARKRHVTVPLSDSVASTAKTLLLENGMPSSICRLVCDLLVEENHDLLEKIITCWRKP